MKHKLTPQQIIDKAYKRYMCLQTEDMYLEYHNTYWVINWHNFMDSYINYKKVGYVAKFIRKYSDLPIYDAVGLLNV